MIRSRNCYSCNYYKDGYCENLELKPCYPQKGCEDFSRRMTREEAIEFGNMWLQINEDCKDSNTYAFFQMAIKALEQEPILDKIRAEIEKWHKEGTNWSNIRLIEIEIILDKEQDRK